MDPLGTIVERLCAWKDVTREKKDGKDSFFVRGQVFAYLGKKGVVVKLAPPQVTEALKIIGAKRMPDDGDPHSREFVEIPVTTPREVERAMMWPVSGSPAARAASGAPARCPARPDTRVRCSWRFASWLPSDAPSRFPSMAWMSLPGVSRGSRARRFVRLGGWLVAPN
jgi:hypothetical protein